MIWTLEVGGTHKKIRIHDPKISHALCNRQYMRNANWHGYAFQCAICGNITKFDFSVSHLESDTHQVMLFAHRACMAERSEKDVIDHYRNKWANQNP